MYQEWKDEAYSNYSSAFKGKQSNLERQKAADRFLRLVRPHLVDISRTNAVDLGAGQGQLMQALLSLGFDITGVELSEEQAEIARQEGLNVETGDGLDFLMKLPSNSIGLVTCFDVLEHLTKQQASNWMKQIYRVLKSGGILLGHVPNGLSPFFGSAYWGDLTHEWCPVPESIEMLCRLSNLNFIGCFENTGCSSNWKGQIRASGWGLIRYFYSILYMLDTGAINDSQVWSRVMLFKANKS